MIWAETPETSIQSSYPQANNIYIYIYIYIYINSQCRITILPSPSNVVLNGLQKSLACPLPWLQITSKSRPCSLCRYTSLLLHCEGMGWDEKNERKEEMSRKREVHEVELWRSYKGTHMFRNIMILLLRISTLRPSSVRMFH